MNRVCTLLYVSTTGVPIQSAVGRFIMFHCNKQYELENIWYLKDKISDEPSKHFIDRMLGYGTCNVCGKLIVTYKQVRNSDKKVFIDTLKGEKAQKLMNREKPNIIKMEYRYKSKKKYSTVGITAWM